MKAVFRSILFVALVSVLPFAVSGQEQSAAQRVDDLRLQLLDLEAKESELKERAQQLDEALKPENIERSLAGIGSTRPEELREQRRRELSIEREGLQRQLNLVADSKIRLESSLRDAEARAYQESARATIVHDELSASTVFSRRLLGAGVVVIAAMGVVAFFLIRRIRLS